MSKDALYCSQCGKQLGYIYCSTPTGWVECMECEDDESPDYPDGPEFDGWEERNGYESISFNRTDDTNGGYTFDRLCILPDTTSGLQE